jgi:ketosteroid isomerase-like protein
MPIETTTLADRLVDALRDADWDAVIAFYAPDVLLDMNLPMWRFQIQGREAATHYLHEQAARFANLRTTQHRVHRSGDTLVVEEEMRFDGEGGEHLWRAVDIFHLDGDTVAEHAQYCTGVWTPDEIARQAVEAPMVRW